MRHKISSRKGFTLAEALIVVVILALMTSAGAVATSAVMASRVNMIQAADAEILGSTAFQAISNELRFGQNIEIGEDNKSVTLDSLTYGLDSTIFLDGGKLKYGSDAKDQILTESAYSGLDISSLVFTQKEDGSIHIALAVSGNKGRLWSGELTVVPLNGLPDSST